MPKKIEVVMEEAEVNWLISELKNQIANNLVVPKLRSIQFKLFKRLAGFDHADFKSFKVFCWFSPSQKIIDGSRLWRINGQVKEATYVSLDPNDRPTYRDAVRLGTSREWIENGDPSLGVLENVIRKAEDPVLVKQANKEVTARLKRAIHPTMVTHKLSRRVHR